MNDKQLWQNALTKLKAKCKQDATRFSLTVNDVINVLTDVCPYTGLKIFRRDGTGSGWQPNTPTLVMKDKSIGYIKENVEVVSNLAATLLHTLTKDQLSVLAYCIHPKAVELPLMQQMDELSTRVFDAATNEKQCEEIIEAMEVKFTRRSKAIRKSLK